MSDLSEHNNQQRSSRGPAAWSNKKKALVAGGALCASAWIALGVGLAMGVETPVRVTLFVVALLLTEGLAWLAAAVLGLTVVQARKRLFDKALSWRGRNAN